MKLSELCEFIVDSEHKTAPTQETGHPMIRTPNLGRGVFLLDGVRRVSEETYEAWTRRGRPKYGDLILAREAPVGNVAMVPQGLKPCLGQRTVLIRPKHKEIDAKYLAFLIVGDEIQGRIHGMSSGATVAHLNMKDIRNLELPQLPDLPTQRKIASILSAYDDLIENNTRRIAILEEMAQAIYREWFVNFRFPGHENVKLVDSPRGQIPEGWEVVTLKDVCVEKKGIQTGPFGSQLHQSDYTDNGTPVVMPKDIFDARISTDSIARVPDEVCNRLPRHRLEVGDTVCARRGEIGRNAFVTERESQWMCGTGCMRMRPRKTVISPRFLFDYLCTPDIVSLIAGKAAGAIMPNLNIGIMESVPILLPPRCVQLSYECLAMENLELVSTLVSKNRNLSTTRDLLLPKLISGQLDVEDLDIDVGMTAEELAEAAAG